MVQATIRGFLQRRKYRIQKMTSEVQSKYFKSDEAKETLVGMYKMTAQLNYRIYTRPTRASGRAACVTGVA